MTIVALPEPVRTEPAYTLPAALPTVDVLALLAAIRDALTVPFPAVGFESQRGWLLTDRASEIRAAIANIQRGQLDGEVVTARWWADHLRQSIEEMPPTYPQHETPAAVAR